MHLRRILAPAVFLALFTGLAGAQKSEGPNTFRFDLGAGPAAPGYVKAAAGTVYSAERGYGFEPGANLTAVNRGGTDPLRADFVTSDAPFYFSVAVPEGNYKVTVVLGDSEAESVTTVKAELRRLMLENVRTKPAAFVTRSFIVNVRRAVLPTGGEVRLKPRETTSEAWAWDDKLTLEFSGKRPAVCGIEIERANNVPTVYLAGDSTVTDQPVEPYASWGQMLPRFFTAEVAIANHSESGESLRGFIGENRLAKVMSVIKPGDYLFVQMGHNDQKDQSEGAGAFTTYRAALKRFIAEARQHQATPVLITPMNRRNFDAEGKVTNSLGDFPEAVRQTAKEENVALIDLHAMSKVLYEAFGRENSVKAFAPGDATHHNNYGSYELARCVVEAIRKSDLPLAKSLSAGVKPFDPAQPDPMGSFDVPASPSRTAVKPYDQ